MNRAICSILVVLLLATAPIARAADPMPSHDRALIKELLHRLKDRKDLTFIREDKTYDAKAAAWYLQYKWDQNKDKVHSIEDFINLSSHGGDHNEITYYVKFADGTKKPAKDVLEESMKTLEHEQTEK